jgi:hypothetical protein
MLTIISVIFVVSIITIIVSAIRAFVLKPTETAVSNTSNNTLVYPADHPKSITAHEKRWNKNHLILKVSLTLTVVSGIIIFILKSI